MRLQNILTGILFIRPGKSRVILASHCLCNESHTARPLKTALQGRSDKKYEQNTQIIKFSVAKTRKKKLI